MSTQKQRRKTSKLQVAFIANNYEEEDDEKENEIEQTEELIRPIGTYSCTEAFP